MPLLVDIRIVRADAEAAEQTRQEVEDLVVGDLEPADLARAVEVGRTADEARVSVTPLLVMSRAMVFE